MTEDVLTHRFEKLHAALYEEIRRSNSPAHRASLIGRGRDLASAEARERRMDWVQTRLVEILNRQSRQESAIAVTDREDKRRSEILAWLREEARVCEAAEDAEPYNECWSMLHEAADEIEALVAEVDSLRASAVRFMESSSAWKARAEAEVARPAIQHCQPREEDAPSGEEDAPRGAGPSQG